MRVARAARLVLSKTAVLFGAALVAALPAERAGATAWSPSVAAADTLRYQVRAGQALLVSLPPRAGGAEAAYAVVRAPAMSWLVDRSFLWQTIPSERGLMAIVLRETSARREELVLLVEVTD